MEHDQVSRWLQAYVEAWKSYDPESIGALFADRAEYRFHPYDEPLSGREAIVQAWLDDRDAPGTYDGRYEPLAIDGETAVATGASTYYSADGSVEKVYDNCFVMRFDGEGRCRELTEYYVKRP